MGYDIKIQNFEGPLDLLLHLIKKNEMDIYDIPIVDITRQYLDFIDSMQSLNLDLAGEFLLMAATLLHIKSKLLLPAVADEEEAEVEEEDPRAELVRRLLEYQKYKEAAETLSSGQLLGRDVFVRRAGDVELDAAADEELIPVGLFELTQALAELLRTAPAELVHEVDVERLSVTDRINGILEQLGSCDSLPFNELFSETPQRHEVVVTFLAMLELVKLRLVRLMQNARFGTIWLFPEQGEESAAAAPMDEDRLGYQ